MACHLSCKYAHTEYNTEQTFVCALGVVSICPGWFSGKYRCEKIGRGHPVAFVNPGRRLRVMEIYDYWCESGQWWEGEPEHHVFRLIADDGGFYDIEEVGKEWFLYRVWD
ncbi:DUF6504 family protein [Alicyclobacillus herbarius]|uniref:DUF6504 family protein n=1 Tax=Alicyclobacillus herbarius TaxID=122960 RepID=UPI00316ACDEC